MKHSQLIVPTSVMLALAFVLVVIGYMRGEGQHIQGVKNGVAMIGPILPLIVLAFIVSGMIQALVPRDFIVHWIGEGSGFRGIMVGAVAGAATPGGPFISFPIAAGLLRAGGCIGPIVAYLTGWLLLAVTRLPLEVGILGWKLTFARVACSFFVPPIAGLIAQSLFGCSEWTQTTK